MKTFLAVAAAVGLSVSAAAASCPGHKVTASTEKEVTVAGMPAGTVSAPEADDKKDN